MIRPALGDDFVNGFRECGHLVDDMPAQWSLKLLGTLFCHQHIETYQPDVALEAGVGCNKHFYRRCADKLDYWTLDQAGFYPEERFAQALEARPKSTFVNGLLGEQLPELPDNKFDMTFTVSVLEHVPDEAIKAICDDLYRITKPGGWTLHSIDLRWTQLPELLPTWASHFLGAGFVAEDQAEIITKVDTILPGGRAMFFEPLEIQYLKYTKAKDKWNPTRPLKDLVTTVLVRLSKPA